MNNNPVERGTLDLPCQECARLQERVKSLARQVEQELVNGQQMRAEIQRLKRAVATYDPAKVFFKERGLL